MNVQWRQAAAEKVEVVDLFVYLWCWLLIITNDEVDVRDSFVYLCFCIDAAGVSETDIWRRIQLTRRQLTARHLMMMMMRTMTTTTIDRSIDCLVWDQTAEIKSRLRPNFGLRLVLAWSSVWDIGLRPKQSHLDFALIRSKTYTWTSGRTLDRFIFRWDPSVRSWSETDKQPKTVFLVSEQGLTLGSQRNIKRSSVRVWLVTRRGVFGRQHTYVMGTGEFTAESQLLRKIEREKVRARTDPWKVCVHSVCIFLYWTTSQSLTHSWFDVTEDLPRLRDVTDDLPRLRDVTDDLPRLRDVTA